MQQSSQPPQSQPIIEKAEISLFMGKEGDNGGLAEFVANLKDQQKKIVLQRRELTNLEHLSKKQMLLPPGLRELDDLSKSRIAKKHKSST